jgi:hypothetical protein
VVWFDVKVFNIPAYDPDTLIELTWRDVDSLSYPEIKDSLKSIEQLYGKYKLVKNNPEYTEPEIGQDFFIYFENYVNGVNVEKKFRAIPHTDCDFLGGITKINSINEINNSEKMDFIISPNPANEYIEIDVGANCNVPLQNVQFQIYNVYGECVANLTPTLSKGEGVRIGVSGLADGIYFLRIGNETQKFVVIK